MTDLITNKNVLQYNLLNCVFTEETVGNMLRFVSSHSQPDLEQYYLEFLHQELHFNTGSFIGICRISKSVLLRYIQMFFQCQPQLLTDQPLYLSFLVKDDNGKHILLCNPRLEFLHAFLEGSGSDRRINIQPYQNIPDIFSICAKKNIKQQEQQQKQQQKIKVVNTRQFHRIINPLPIILQNMKRKQFYKTGQTTLADIFWPPLQPTEPLYLFHGTDSSVRRRFQSQGIKTNVAYNIVYGQGFYMTTDPEEALRYAQLKYTQRRPTENCMSPLMFILYISYEKAGQWVLGQDFNMKAVHPYYIVLTNQEKARDLKKYRVLYLEDFCFPLL